MKRLVASIILLSFTAAAMGAEAKIVIDASDIALSNTPMERKLAEAPDLPAGAVTLTSSTGAVAGQLDIGDDGATVRWIEPNLPAGEAKSYALSQAEKPPAVFRFSDGEGWRDLYHGDVPVWRDMIKWDPADRENTFKPFEHVHAFGPADSSRAESGPDSNPSGGHASFITKGPGGKFPHHRGIFFGYKAQAGGQDLGDFWHGREGVTQRHVKYLTAEEFAGPVAARCAGVTDWVGKDGKMAVVRDTRTETTWRAAPDHLILDYDIEVISLLDKPVRLFADAHHGGFHFRAAQEVADALGANGKPGAATYERPGSAKDTGNDIWADCPWVRCAFDVKGVRYVVTMLDHPSNPRPTTFSTRPYGRFGAYFDREVTSAEPLKLKYRLDIQSAASAGRTDADAAWQAFVKMR